MNRIISTNRNTVIRFAVCSTLFSLFFLFSCRKDERVTGTSTTLQTLDGVPGDIRSWFAGRYPRDSVVTNAFAIYDPAPKVAAGAPMHFEFTPTWDRGKTSYKPDSTVVEVPVVNHSSISFAIKDPDGERATQNNSVTRLLILKKGSRTRSVFMTVIADDTYQKKDQKLEKISLLKKDKSFNGTVLYHTMQGYFLNGFTYKNGRPVARISVPGQFQQNKRSGKNASVSTDGCTTYAIELNYHPADCLHFAGLYCPGITVKAYYQVCNTESLNPDTDSGNGDHAGNNSGNDQPANPEPEPEYNNWRTDGGFPWNVNPNTGNNANSGGGLAGFNDGPDDPCGGHPSVSSFDNGGSGSINVPCDENGRSSNRQFIRDYSVGVTRDLINETQNSFELNFGFSEAEKLEIGEAVFARYEGMITSNFTALQSFGTAEEDPEIVAWLRSVFRKAVGLDAPENAQDAAEIAALRSSLVTVGGKVKQLHDNHLLVFGFAPGYAAFNNYVRGHEGYAAVNMSLDLFGGSIIKGVARVGKSVIYVSDLTTHFPSIARSLKAAGVIDLRFVHFNSSQKYAIIGQTMDRVLGARDIINKAFEDWAQTFKPSIAAELEFNNLLQTVIKEKREIKRAEALGLKIYAENQAWINRMKNEGYNIIDVGKNYLDPHYSFFYEMERRSIYLR